MTFELEKLPYELDSLSPYMSKETLEYHYGKHHLAYVNNLNALLENSDLKGKALEEIIKASYNKKGLEGIFNNAAQNHNHIEFWKSLKASSNAKIPGKVQDIIVKSFGSFEIFKEQLLKAGAGVFGSGWLWLVKEGDKLEILQTSNAVNPLALGKHAVLGCDVWEHTYYIDYRNKRPDFLKAWFENLINWEYVESKL